jgi:hypothetical protein
MSVADETEPTVWRRLRAAHPVTAVDPLKSPCGPPSHSTTVRVSFLDADLPKSLLPV